MAYTNLRPSLRPDVSFTPDKITIARARLPGHRFPEAIEPARLIESLQHPKTAASPDRRIHDALAIRRQTQPYAWVAVALRRKIFGDVANDFLFLGLDVERIQDTSVRLDTNTVEFLRVGRKGHLNRLRFSIAMHGLPIWCNEAPTNSVRQI